MNHYNIFLHDAPLRLQRLRLRLQNYDIKIIYKADALSWNFKNSSSKYDEFNMDVEAHVRLIVKYMPISNENFAFSKRGSM